MISRARCAVRATPERIDAIRAQPDLWRLPESNPSIEMSQCSEYCLRVEWARGGVLDTIRRYSDKERPTLAGSGFPRGILEVAVVYERRPHVDKHRVVEGTVHLARDIS